MQLLIRGATAAMLLAAVQRQPVFEVALIKPNVDAVLVLSGITAMSNG